MGLSSSGAPRYDPEMADVSTLRRQFEMGQLSSLSGAGSSVPWNAANEAIYIAIRVRETITVKSIKFRTGSVGATGNYDVGIYDSDAEGAPSTRLTSLGSTAYPAASTEVSANVADVTLTPGLYYLAFVLDNTTDTITVSGTLAITEEFLRRFGMWAEASALPLPATATPTLSPTSAARAILMHASRDT